MINDDFAETDSFRYTDRRIGQLLDKLNAKKLCGCCTGRALLYHGISLIEQTRGSAEVIEMCEGFIRALRERDRPASDSSRMDKPIQ
jgi:hypothetical protein